MKKTLIVVFSIFFILFFNINIFGQLVSVGVGGGITQVLGPDSYTEDVSKNGLGFSTEYNFGVIGKVGLPLIPLTPRAFILYHTLNGSGNADLSLLKTATEQEIEFSQSILTVGAGVQYGFIPVPAGVDPYLALDIMFNSFGNFTTKVNGQETTASGESRFGLGVGVGAEVTLIPMINLDVSATYKWFNLVGKEDNEETISAVNLDLFFMFSFL